jgi:DNA-binding NarL/FixJ family response regulator
MAAREAVERQHPAVVVLDLDAAVEESLSFVRELMEKHPNLPIMGLASRGSARLIEKGKAAGLVDLVGKFDRQGLLASVSDVLGGYGAAEWGAAA